MGKYSNQGAGLQLKRSSRSEIESSGPDEATPSPADKPFAVLFGKGGLSNGKIWPYTICLDIITLST